MKKFKDKILEKILKEIDLLLKRFLNGEYKLILFGSRARGEESEFSDVDLMVILDDKISNFSRGAGSFGETKEKIREIIYDFSVKSPYLFSVLIVSKSLAEKRKGFLVFDSVEKDGILIGA